MAKEMFYVLFYNEGGQEKKRCVKENNKNQGTNWRCCWNSCTPCFEVIVFIFIEIFLDSVRLKKEIKGSIFQAN